MWVASALRVSGSMACKWVVRTDDGGATLFTLLDQECQQLAPYENIQIDGDFIKQQNVPVAHEAHAQLYTSSFAVRDLVHSPERYGSAKETGIKGEFEWKIISSADQSEGVFSAADAVVHMVGKSERTLTR
jgi:hypothetical protein